MKIFQKVFDLQSGHEINGLSLSNIIKGDNAKSKKDRVVILVCDTSSCTVLHFCQVQLKYSKGYSSYRPDEKSISNKTRQSEGQLYPPHPPPPPPPQNDNGAASKFKAQTGGLQL